jgi:flagellar assembly protein FliH
VAATSAIPANLKETDPPDAPVLERLQYRIVQSSKGPAAASLRDGPTGRAPASARPLVALFPSHADGLFGMQDATEATDRQSEPETDWLQTVAELEKRLTEEQFAAAQAVATAQEQGRREGRQAMEGQVAVEQQRLQAQLLQTLDEFRLERQNYFHHVEGEVVRLALAIAARVLHREAQLDPLLLAGAVRVVLDKLGDSPNVVMRVPPPEVVRWKEFFRSTGNARIQPGILEDPSLSPGECVLATQLGVIELGVRAQLEEIEKGFFDLLDRRPTGTGANSAPTSRGAA